MKLPDSMNRKSRGAAVCALFAAMVLACAAPASAQKNKKNQTPAKDSAAPLLPPTDQQAIERIVGEALGAQQIGDVQLMHKYYSDDVVVVSGTWQPPVIGWDNYVPAFEAVRAQLQNPQIIRKNTYTKVMGDSAWVTYQWEYMASAGGKPVDFHGHTTLVLAKQNGRWLITLDHSSVVPDQPAQEAAPAADDKKPGPR